MCNTCQFNEKSKLMFTHGINVKKKRAYPDKQRSKARKVDFGSGFSLTRCAFPGLYFDYNQTDSSLQ